MGDQASEDNKPTIQGSEEAKNEERYLPRIDFPTIGCCSKQDEENDKFFKEMGDRLVKAGVITFY